MKWKTSELPPSSFRPPILLRGSSSVGRASAFQAEGREFEPRLPLQFINVFRMLSDARVAQG